MKIAIVGMGVAGAYLASRLNQHHDITGFDMLKKDNFDAVCAWGTSRHGIAEFASRCGLDFEKYVLHDGIDMKVDLGDDNVHVPLKGLVNFDKLKFIQDLIGDTKVHYGKYVSRGELVGNYDLIVDATGLTRPLLPRIKEDSLVPFVQHKIKFKKAPFDDFYIRPFNGLSGYFWYFPLEENVAHVGGGDIYKRHIGEIQKFVEEYDCEVLTKVGRPVRILPPSKCKPFYDGKIVGVGESIGTVFPMLGEGIIPSLECAEILVENLNDLEAYEKAVLKKFEVYEAVHRFVEARHNPGVGVLRQVIDLSKTFIYLKKNEKRFGLVANPISLLKVVASMRELKAEEIQAIKVPKQVIKVPNS